MPHGRKRGEIVPTGGSPLWEPDQTPASPLNMLRRLKKPDCGASRTRPTQRKPSARRCPFPRSGCRGHGGSAGAAVPRYATASTVLRKFVGSLRNWLKLRGSPAVAMRIGSIFGRSAHAASRRRCNGKMPRQRYWPAPIPRPPTRPARAAFRYCPRSTAHSEGHKYPGEYSPWVSVRARQDQAWHEAGESARQLCLKILQYKTPFTRKDRTANPNFGVPKFFKVRLACRLPVLIRRGKTMWEIGICCHGGRSGGMLYATRLTDRKEFPIKWEWNFTLLSGAIGAPCKYRGNMK